MRSRRRRLCGRRERRERRERPYHAPSRHTPTPSPSYPRAPLVIPAPFPVIPAQAGTHALPTPPRPLFPNSSLPPSRGEVRWGVEGREPAPPTAPHPDHPRRTHAAPMPHQRSPSYPLSLRHSYSSLPSFLPPFSVIPAQAGTTHPAPLFPNSSLPPSRGEVRWGVEGREPAHQSRPTPITHAALPPHQRSPSYPLPSVIPAPPLVIPAPPLVIPAQAGTTHPAPLFPNSSLPPSRGEVR